MCSSARVLQSPTSVTGGKVLVHLGNFPQYKGNRGLTQDVYGHPQFRGHNSSPLKGSNPLLTVASVRYSTGLLTGAAVVPSVQNIFILLYHTLERATMKAYGEGRNLTPAIQKTLNRSSPRLVQVIKSGCLPMCKILSKSVRGFRFCACLILHPSGQSYSAIWGDT